MVLIPKPEGFQRPMAKGFLSSGGDDLNRQTAFKIMGVEFMKQGFLRMDQFIDERLVFVFAEGAIEVRGIVLLIARLELGFRKIDAVFLDDRGAGVKEGKVLLPRQRCQLFQ